MTPAAKSTSRPRQDAITKAAPAPAGRKTASKGGQINTQQILTIVSTVIVLTLLVVFVLTGKDWLGLFTPTELTPTAQVVAVTPATLAPGGGDWWNVYFTDPVNKKDPNNLAGTTVEQLLRRIDAAQRSIHIAAFEFNLTPVAEALIAAHRRGVEVRWVTDNEYGIGADAEEDHGQFAMLKQAGIEVKDDGRSALMHNKFIILDGQSVWTGSTNLTINCNFFNNNNVLFMRSPELAAIYEREFAEMWDGQFGPRSPSTVDQQSVTIDGTPVQVYFASEDKAISRLIPLVQGANKSIRFMAFSFTHTDLGNAMLARARAGVDIKGIFELRGSETQDSELTPLYCAQVPVRQDGNSRTFHHKVIVIDDEIVITGSLNFSNNADTSNDENVVVVRNRDIAAQYLQEFERRWAEANEPRANKITCP